MSSVAISAFASLPWGMIITILGSATALGFAWWHGYNAGSSAEQIKTDVASIRNEQSRDRTDDEVAKSSDSDVRDRLSQWGVRHD